MTIYLQLFFSFLKVGALSFGGGYATMPFIQAEVVNKYHWLSMEDFTNLITISQMTPGPIAINSATFVGNQLAGIGGSIVATLGCICPACIIVTIIAHFYIKYRKLSLMENVLSVLRPAVVSMILVAGLYILVPAVLLDQELGFTLQNLNIRYIAYFLLAMTLLFKKADPIKIMFLFGIVECVYTQIFH